MTLPQWLTDALNNADKLHITSDAVKIGGIIAGLCVGFFGHDWAAAATVLTGSLGTSLAVSQMARKAGN